MMANSAFLAAMAMLVMGFLILEQVPFLSAYKRVILQEYLWSIGGVVTLVFLNLVAGCYLVSRHLFLKETGRKLAHVEKQLQAGDAIARDLSERLEAEE
jgi:hypothetical protein